MPSRYNRCPRTVILQSMHVEIYQDSQRFHVNIFWEQSKSLILITPIVVAKDKPVSSYHIVIKFSSSSHNDN